MRLYDINGKLKFLNVSKYRIQWEKSSRSNVQFLVKQFLKQYWTNNIVYEEFPVYGSRMKVDILNATKKIAIMGLQNLNPMLYVNMLLKPDSSI